MIKIAESYGVTLKDALDNIVCDLVKEYNISQRDAKRLLAETLIRTCVYDEILGAADVLLQVTRERA